MISELLPLTMAMIIRDEGSAGASYGFVDPCSKFHQIQMT